MSAPEPLPLAPMRGRGPSGASRAAAPTLLSAATVRCAVCAAVLAVMLAAAVTRRLFGGPTLATLVATPPAAFPAADSPAAQRSIFTPPPPLPLSTAATASIYSRSRLVPTTFRVVATHAHDSSAFTQGLAWRDRVLYEGTGLTGGRSRLRTVDFSTGQFRVLREAQLPGGDGSFGEGVAVWPAAAADLFTGSGSGNSDASSADEPATVVQLTWQNRQVYLWEAGSLRPRGSMGFSSAKNEGWGLTHDGVGSLIESDGSEFLHFWDPPPPLSAPLPPAATEQRRVRVIDRLVSSASAGGLAAHGIGFGQGVLKLNELEYVHGWVLANIWYDARVAIIDPATGAAVWFLDFSELLRANQGQGEDCLNGLAYTMRLDNGGAGSGVASESWGGRLWVTGKLWKRIYEVELSGLVDAAKLVDPQWLGP